MRLRNALPPSFIILVIIVVLWMQLPMLIENNQMMT